MKKKKTHSKSTDKFDQLLENLKGADPGKTDLQTFYKAAVARKSKQNIQRFSSIPFSERIILLPQCLRKIEKCKAKDLGNRYDCHECGACKIAKIIQKARKIGYKDIYILKGGSAVAALIEKDRPGAILGVACYYEGLIGITECENRGIPVQFVPLTRDGCVNTDLNLTDLENLMGSKK